MIWHTAISGWHKSSYSDRDFENCVEVGDAPGLVGIRDTKESGLLEEVRPVLVLSRASAARFLAHVKTGAADLAR